MKPIKFHILFLLSTIYVIVLMISKNIPLAYAYTVILLLYGLMDFRLGLSSWIVIIPLTGALEGYFSVIYSIVLVFAYVIKLLNNKEKIYKNNFGNYLFLLSLLSMLSMLLTGYVEYFHVLIVLLSVLFSAFIISQQIIKDKENVFYIGNAFIISALVATLSSFFVSTDFKRLSLGDNVRELANIIGIGMVLMVSLYYFKSKPIKNVVVLQQYRIVNKLKLIVIIVLVVGLVSTMSRGVILAVFVSIFSLIFFSVFKNIKKFKIGVIVKGFIFLVALLAISFYYSDTTLKVLNINTELLSERFSEEGVEGGTGIRQKIWLAGISGLEGGQIVYGHGLSSFKMLASKKGYDYYAHSVFVDILVTTGILGFSVLMVLYFSTLSRIIKYRELMASALLIFLTFNYISHGKITADIFWYSFAICIGLINYKK